MQRRKERKGGKHMGPKTIASKQIYKGKVFDVRVDTIRENGKEHDREIVIHSGSVVILPVFDDGSVALVRQYRHAAGKDLLELAAGGIEDGEDPETGALRELEEEIGVTAESVEKLCEFYVSPGFLTEKMHVFLATGLTEVGQKLEADEILTIERHSFDALREMIRTGEIEDAKTIVGIKMASNSDLFERGSNG